MSHEAGGAEQAVPLISKRRELGLLLQQVQHGLPSIVLLGHGISRLQHEPHGWVLVLALAEIGVSALVLGSFLPAMRAFRTNRLATDVHATHSHHVDWIDIFLGLMLAVEVWSHWHETGHIRRPTLLLVPVMLALGLLHGRIDALRRRRRALRISESGVTIGGKFFSRFTATWEELSRIEIEPRRARLVRKDGRVRAINLADLKNEPDVRAVLASARAQLQSRRGSSAS